MCSRRRTISHWSVLALLVASAATCGESHSATGPATSSDSGLSDGSKVGDSASTRYDDWWLDFSKGVSGKEVPTDAGAVRDGSGNGIDATASAGLQFTYGHPYGAMGISFGGNGKGIAVPNSDVAKIADFEATDAFTIEVGFRTDVHGREGAAGSAVLLERVGGWALSVIDGTLVFSIASESDGPTGSLTLASPSVSDGRWHRVIVSRDAANHDLRLEFDGAFSAHLADPTDGHRVTGESALQVGAHANGSGALLGSIDHVRIRRQVSARFAPVDVGSVTTVFQAGVEQTPGGGNYTSIRLPAIVEDSDGSLLAVAEGRVDDSCDFGNIDVVAKRSTDHGRTWSAIKRLTDNGTGKVGNPIPFVDSVRHRLVLLTSFTDVQGGACSDPVSGSVKFKVQHSDDHGVTWSAPVDITAQVSDPDWNNGGLIGPSHGIQLRSGSNAGTLAVHAMHRRKLDDLRGGHLLVSTDGGDTWSIAAKETGSAPKVQVNESTAAELSDGRLYVNVRDQIDPTSQDRLDGLRGQGFITSALKYEATPALVRTSTFRGPVVHGATLRWVGSDRYGDEPRVLFTFPAGESGSNFSQRHDLRLYASHDDAVSFSPGVRVFGGLASYSDSVALDDAHVGVIYESANDGEAFNARIQFRPITFQQIDDPTLFGWTFEDAAVGKPLGNSASTGLHPIPLIPEGTPTVVAGRHHSTAVRLDGSSRVCASLVAIGPDMDLDIRDGFEVELTFRTTAHASGGATSAGTLISKSAVGTASAWWIRVEDGKVRFAVGDDAANLDSVISTESVSDGSFHTVLARRDTTSKHLTVAVDGGKPASVPITTTGIVSNNERLCMGAFAGVGVPRAFTGDVDSVAVRLTN